jgi:hypothetical protein
MSWFADAAQYKANIEEMEENLLSLRVGNIYNVLHMNGRAAQIVRVLSKCGSSPNRSGVWYEVEDMVYRYKFNLPSTLLGQTLTEMEIIAWSARGVDLSPW